MSASRAMMLGFLRRLERSRHAEELVLRGSLLTSTWFGADARAATDVDLLGLGPFDATRAEAMFAGILAAVDPGGETTFDLASAATQVIWAETASPGLRVVVAGTVRDHDREVDLQIDLGHDDPLALPPTPITIPSGDEVTSPAATVLGVLPETMLAWKIHGLFEFGHGTWRPKDLYDAWLFATRAALREDAFVSSLRLAFESRSTPLSAADRFLFTDEWGRSGGSRRRWASFGRKSGLNDRLPAITSAIEAVRARVLPAFAALGARAPGTAPR